jgi:nucleoside-diphosphate-sugar epimerase
MKVFITGITGFLGSKLSQTLAEKGHTIGGLVRNVSSADRPTAENTEAMIRGNMFNGMSLYYGDLTDFIAVREALRNFQPDVIIHLGAQTSVAYSFTHYDEVMRTNFFGSVNMAEAAREVVPNLKRFIISGSVEEYGNQEVMPIKETVELRAASPYGVAKIAAEKYLRYLYEAYKFPCVIFRNANSYGRRFNHQFVIESMIYQMLNKQPVTKLGDPKPIRDFIYSYDLLSAYVMAAESDSPKLNGESINVGTSEGVTIQALAEKIARLTDYSGEIKWYCYPPRSLEIWSLVIDNTKAKKLLNWSPKYNLDSGLQETISYWKGKSK